VTGLKALKNLKILSLGRNCLKKMDGIGMLCFPQFLGARACVMHRSIFVPYSTPPRSLLLEPSTVLYPRIRES